jgi:alanyl-tRNA synthetase
VIETYHTIYPELDRNRTFILNNLAKEEKAFNKTLKTGLRKLRQLITTNGAITGQDAFLLFTSFGFPVEMTREIAAEHGLEINLDAFEKEFEHHRQISRESTTQKFTSGLADHSELTTQLHTATHLLHQALRDVLGDHVQQQGSNITPERIRFDINAERKLTADELETVERIMNEKIASALPVTRETMTVDAARTTGARGLFREKYDEHVHVYTIGAYSKEICAGPHVANTSQIGKIRIQKQRKIGVATLRLYVIPKEST